MSKTLRSLFALAALAAPLVFAGCEEEKKPAAGGAAAPAPVPAKPADAKPADAKPAGK